MSRNMRSRTVVLAGLLLVWSSLVLIAQEPPREKLPGAVWISGDATLGLGEAGENSVLTSRLSVQRYTSPAWRASYGDVRPVSAESLDVARESVAGTSGGAGHPALPCGCEDWVPWYIGLDGAYAFGLNDTPNVEHAGINHDVTALGTHLEDIGLVNFRLGRRLSPCWRVDVSYTWMEGNYDWRWFRETNPGTLGGTFFDSFATSHLLLFNGYRHLFPLDERCGKLQFDPYVGAGIGVAFNRMAEADQKVISTGDVVTTIFPDTTACFAARFVLGSQFWLTPTLALDMSFTTTYLGEIQTDAFTVIKSTGQIVPLGRYDFHDNWIGAAYVGLIWYPRPGFFRG